MPRMYELSTTEDIELVAISPRERGKLQKIIGSDVIYLSPAVLWFAVQMEAKLARINKDILRDEDKGDSFMRANKEKLLKRLKYKIQNLEAARGPHQHINEAVDVANYTMFIAITKGMTG